MQLFPQEQNISAALNRPTECTLRKCVSGTFPDFALSECTTEYAVATVPPATESMYHCVGLSQSSALAGITAQSRSALPRADESRTTWQSWSLGLRVHGRPCQPKQARVPRSPSDNLRLHRLFWPASLCWWAVRELAQAAARFNRHRVAFFPWAQQALILATCPPALPRR